MKNLLRVLIASGLMTVFILGMSGVAWAENLSVFAVWITLAACTLAWLGGGYKKLKLEDKPRWLRAILLVFDLTAIILFASAGWFWCAAAWTFTTLLVWVGFPALQEMEAEGKDNA